MKNLLFTAILVFITTAAFSQDDEYQKFLENRKKQMQEKAEASQKRITEMDQEYRDYVDRMNAEFTEFVAKQWELFNEFKKEQLAMTDPKMDKAPVASEPIETEKVVSGESSDIEYNAEEELPKVTEVICLAYEGKNDNNYELKTRVDKSGVVDLPAKNYVEVSRPEPVAAGTEIRLNFYGREVPIHVSQKLKARSKGVDEQDVADYFANIAKNREETKALWDELTVVVDHFGLNEWGYFCLLRSLSEKMFTNIDDRVLFCFYMLRNEGNFKTRVARGQNSDKLTLLIALDNSKQVYSYTFFRFADNEDATKKVKYYTVYGGGKAKEPVYSYSFCKQDAEKKEMGLDFTKNLNMGACDVTRTVQLTKKRSVTLPYNKAHMAYLNDVPMTVFPIYFENPIAIEAQKVLQNNFNEMPDQYTPTQFIQMLLHFVQTGFEYKTDDAQFGYEKYFYPEEVIGYPYCDCEDRSALFAWLVQKYTNAKVIGLQYEGHVATAVWFGDDVKLKGDGFMYGGKKYYVCDPTYINASIGMTMPQFKGKTPKIIKLRK